MKGVTSVEVITCPWLHMLQCSLFENLISSQKSRLLSLVASLEPFLLKKFILTVIAVHSSPLIHEYTQAMQAHFTVSFQKV